MLYPQNLIWPTVRLTFLDARIELALVVVLSKRWGQVNRAGTENLLNPVNKLRHILNWRIYYRNKPQLGTAVFSFQPRHSHIHATVP